MERGFSYGTYTHATFCIIREGKTGPAKGGETRTDSEEGVTLMGLIHTLRYRSLAAGKG